MDGVLCFLLKKQFYGTAMTIASIIQSKTTLFAAIITIIEMIYDVIIFYGVWLWLVSIFITFYDIFLWSMVSVYYGNYLSIKLIIIDAKECVNKEEMNYLIPQWFKQTLSLLEYFFNPNFWWNNWKKLFFASINCKEFVLCCCVCSFYSINCCQRCNFNWFICLAHLSVLDLFLFNLNLARNTNDTYYRLSLSVNTLF